MKYSSTFYGRYAEGSIAAARAILPAVFELVSCRSVIDVGCGIGAWLSVAAEYGISDYFGVDGEHVDRRQLKIDQSRFQSHDLARPLNLPRKFDLATSIEVAEHIPGAHARTFVGTLVRLSPVVLFSAAIPFQGGTDHVNEQWPAYWATLFAEHGYYFFDCLRPRFWNDTSIPYWYRQNAFVVAERAFFADRNLTMPMTAASLVHPELWTQRNLRSQHDNFRTKIHRSLAKISRRISTFESDHTV